MDLPVLTLVDVTGIQRFIFGSSRLRQNARASDLLKEATTDVKGGWLDTLGYLPNVIIADGGNCLLRFSGMDQAKTFAARFSKRALMFAPELEMVIVHESYEEGAVAEAVSRIYTKTMPKAKSAFLPRGIMLDLGIAEECFETGQPAYCYDEQGNPISGVTYSKDKRGAALRSFEDLLSEHKCCNDDQILFQFPVDMDNLGRSRGESSLVAVVHMDGNNTGSLINQWLEANDGLPDDEFLIRYASISKGLNQAVHNTMRAVVKRICGSISKKTNGLGDEFVLRGKGGEFELYSSRCGEKNIVYLPLRPIIAAGEDIAFVCDARIGLDLTAAAIEEFERQHIPELCSLTACAGVSIVHAHSPFISAYNMAEQLCSNAKQTVRNRYFDDGQWFSAIDWHIDPTAGIYNLSELRKERTSLDGHYLTMKPYIFDKSLEPGTWRWFFEEILYGPRGFFSDVWQAHRSKLKTLQRLVARRQYDVEKSMLNWRVTSREILFPGNLEEGSGFVHKPYADGWFTPIIDAAELVGLFISLNGSDIDEH